MPAWQRVGAPAWAQFSRWADMGAVGLILYPLSAFRAMNAAALKVYEAIRRDGTQKNVVDLMQTRADLYKYLDYHAYEQKLDELFAKQK